MRAELETIKSEFARQRRLSGCTVDAWLPAVQSLGGLAKEAEEHGAQMFVRIAP